MQSYRVRLVFLLKAMVVLGFRCSGLKVVFLIGAFGGNIATFNSTHSHG